MPTLYHASRAILWLLIIAGLWSALRVSYTTITGSAPCPDLLAIPACYLVSLGYTFMLVALFVSSRPLKNRLFYLAWTLVFLIAVLGTGFELALGDACPRSSSGVPLCYFSLAFCAAIFLLYLFTSNYAYSYTEIDSIPD